MRQLEPLESGKFLVLFLLCSLLSLQAYAESFDGTWSVLQTCESSPEGARGYKWTYPATVKDGYFDGQYRQEGQSPSMSLKGMIKPDGSASLIAHGISADSDHNIKFAPAQTPINFEVRASFTARRAPATVLPAEYASLRSQRRDRSGAFVVSIVGAALREHDKKRRQSRWE